MRSDTCTSLDELGQPVTLSPVTNEGIAVMRANRQPSSWPPMLAPSSYRATESLSAGGIFQLVIAEPLASWTGTVENQAPAAFTMHATEVPNTDRNSIEESVITARSPPARDMPRRSAGSMNVAWRICCRVRMTWVVLL